MPLRGVFSLLWKVRIIRHISAVREFSVRLDLLFLFFLLFFFPYQVLSVIFFFTADHFGFVTVRIAQM